MKSTLSINPKGQITLPAEMRSKFGFEPGGVLTAEEKDGKIVLSPAVVVNVRYYSDEEIAQWAKDDEWAPGEKELWAKRLAQKKKKK